MSVFVAYNPNSLPFRDILQCYGTLEYRLLPLSRVLNTAYEYMQEQQLIDPKQAYEALRFLRRRGVAFDLHGNLHACASVAHTSNFTTAPDPYTGKSSNHVCCDMVNEPNAFDSGWSEAHDYALLGDLKSLKLLYEWKGKAAVLAQTKNGWHTLHCAAQNGNVEMIRYLCEELGADFKLQNSVGWMPVHSAALFGHQEALVYFFQRGGSDLLRSRTAIGWEPVHMLGFNCTLTDLQLQSTFEWINSSEVGVDLSSGGKDEEGIVHGAAFRGRVHILQWLKDRQLNVNRPRADGIEAIHCAAFAGQLDVMDWLIENGADVHANRMRNVHGYQPVHAAAQGGNVSALQYMIEKKQVRVDEERRDQWTPLIEAAYEGHMDACAWLLSHKANDSAKAVDGFQPVHAAARYGHCEILQLFHDAGVDLHAKLNDGANSFHCCAWQRDLRAIDLLTQYGVQHNAKSSLDLQAVHIACSKTGCRHILDYFLLHHSEKVFEARLSDNADCVLMACHYGQVNALAFLEEIGKSFDNVIHGMLPIHVATKANHRACVEFLVSHQIGGSLWSSMAGPSRQLPIHIAVVEGHEELAMYILATVDSQPLEEHVLQYCLSEMPVDPSGRSAKCTTPFMMNASLSDESEENVLFLAIRHEREALVKFLLHRGAWIPTKISTHHAGFTVAAPISAMLKKSLGRWHYKRHFFFPPRFRAAIYHLLLVQLRLPFPVEVWMYILSFLRRDDFGDSDVDGIVVKTFREELVEAPPPTAV